MEVSKFNEKLNRIDGNIYTIEEVVTPLEGIYEAELIHDNVNIKTLNIYTGSKLTGTKITTYSTSTPSLTPWKTVIKIFSTEPKLYITYETTGDTVEAEDINNLQDAINLTQEELNKETNRATSRENNIEKNLNSEITRAKNAESTESTRAINRENVIEKNLDLEVERAKASEKVLTDNLNTEIDRAKGSEKTISDNLLSEVNRATNVESTITNNLNKEIDRAKAKENSIEINLNNYKTSNDSEIQGLKAKDIDLDNKKANLDYVNLELNKRYTKDQTFTREEVLKKIQDLIGTAPDTLDTFKEIADALGNDPNFATTIMNELSSKVDKVTGKSLSTNDYDNTEKSKLSDVNAKKHEHSNKSIIDKITQGLLDAWNTVSDKANKTDIPSKLSQLTNDKKFITQDDIDTSQNHIHNNKSVLDKISQKTLDDINLSVDKVLKNKLTPIETDSTLTKLDNCIGEYVHNMQIRGKTLQNLWNGGNVNYLSSENRLIETTTLDLYKTNTDYTIINYNNKKIKLGIFTKANTYSRSIEVLPNSKFIIRLNDEIIKDKVGEEVNGWANSDNDKNELKKSIVILEGEVKEIPPYFEGIKSVGEAEGNKISILSKSKNLLDTNNDVKVILNSDGSCLWDGYKLVVSTGGKPAKYRSCYFKIKLYHGINYKLNYKNNIISGIRMCDIKTMDDKYISKGDAGIKFTVPKTDYYKIIFYSTAENEILGNTEYTDITLVANSDDDSYVEPKTDKTEILLPSPHMGLPNGIGDIIDYDKNERIKNVDKMILDGTRGWTVTGVEKPNTIEFQYNFPIIARSSYLLSDKFIFRDADFLWNSDVEGITCNPTRNIQIKILKSKLETPDANGLKKYLQANPVTIYYQLDNPVTEKLSIKDTLQAFENGYIQLDNAITPTTSLEYSTNLPSALSGVVEIQDKILDRVNILEKKKSITWDELEGV
ncbi:hypothetical protein FDB55_06730 [Clostridium botulinum]|uniref:coiled-coil domain-containing protein n=1 Tax=Clostridium botulinum TaxID=1491 RepID=UPI0013F10567|nr:hypothetical protein [Clostridium botulinum]MCS6110367.1 hypothetical protein [Clostridium botulinum]NFE13108.1 hypothetical protein [Clostridium botulinum]NFL42200.1 hypothetical protein [Clostridium botulinum]NFN21433.1 hypothetical protein [Clostridium botulinum]NFN42644.1 hypothetical protein [Clostridium botulinum]